MFSPNSALVPPIRAESICQNRNNGANSTIRSHPELTMLWLRDSNRLGEGSKKVVHFVTKVVCFNCMLFRYLGMVLSGVGGE
jgi:hypothetical protein